MTSPTDLVYRINKKPLPILLLSTVAILAGSVLAYGQASYQTPLNVGSTGPTPISPVNFTPVMISIPLALGAVISLGMFTGLRHPSKHPHQAKIKSKPVSSVEFPPPPSPSEPVAESKSQSYAPPEPQLVEESVEPGNKSLDGIDRILQSLREKDERERENTGGDSAGSSQ